MPVTGVREQISRQLENINGCKPVNYQNAIVAVFPKLQRQQTSLIDKLKTLSNSISGTIGISDEIQGFDHLHHRYLQASAAITLGQQLNLDGFQPPPFQGWHHIKVCRCWLSTILHLLYQLGMRLYLKNEMTWFGSDRIF